MGLVFNLFVLGFLSASTSASVENKYTPHHHLSHCAPFVHTMQMVLVAHSAGNAVGSSVGSSICLNSLSTLDVNLAILPSA